MFPLFPGKQYPKRFVGLNEVHQAQNDLTRLGVQIGGKPQGDTQTNGQKHGGQDQREVVPQHQHGHRSAAPFPLRIPRGTTRFCRASTREPSKKASRAAGMAP